MQKFLEATTAAVALLALIGLVGVSAVSTLAMTPNALGTSDVRGNVAGIDSTSPVVNPFLPVEVTNLGANTEGIFGQLITNSNLDYAYSLKSGSIMAGTTQISLVKIKNPNAAPLQITVSASAVRNVATSVNVNLSDGINSYRLIDHDTVNREVQYEIPANGELAFDTIIVAKQSINFQNELSFKFQVNGFVDF